MAIDPLPEVTPPGEAGADQPDTAVSPASIDAAGLPGKLSEFSQRLASFGLGEAPDPLLTEARPPVKRRSRT
jgi:hypothetical protein